MSWRNEHCFKEIKLKINLRLIHHFDSKNILQGFRKGNELRDVVNDKTGQFFASPPTKRLMMD